MTETATFGAGCFWGVEWVFRKVPGVLDAVSGYSGGTTERPTYREVCSHTTGHAEVVRVTFDPAVVTFEQLLEVFWAMHDPTQVDRQGPDVGDQYRSVIFTETPEQEVQATASKAQGAGAVLEADRDPDRAAHGVLRGGGLPPAVLRGERAHAVLPRVPRRCGGLARPHRGSGPVADHLVRSVAQGLGARRAAPAQRDAIDGRERAITVGDRRPACDADRPVRLERDRRRPRRIRCVPPERRGLGPVARLLLEAGVGRLAVTERHRAGATAPAQRARFGRVERVDRVAVIIAPERADRDFFHEHRTAGHHVDPHRDTVPGWDTRPS